MRTGVLLPGYGNLDPTEIAEYAEDLGYDSVWSPELWGRDAFVQLSAIADATDDIAIGTAIVNVYSRSPAVLAQAAGTLDTLSEGRFTLGVGVSTKKAIEDLHGLSFENPPRRAHETIDLVKSYLDGDGPVTYEGEVFHVADFPSLDADVAVYFAALGKANRRVVARLADGWIPHNIPFPALPEAFEYIAEHARETGRDPDEITVAPYVPAAVSDDPAEARDAIRGHIAYYVGSGEGYRRAVGHRFPEAADTVAEAWRGGDRGAATDAVTEEMVDDLGIAGTPDEARDRLYELVAAGPIDEPILTVPNQAADELAAETVEALAPNGN